MSNNQELKLKDLADILRDGGRITVNEHAVMLAAASRLDLLAEYESGHILTDPMSGMTFEVVNEPRPPAEVSACRTLHSSGIVPTVHYRERTWMEAERKEKARPLPC